MRSKYKKFSERDREAYAKEFAELKKQTGISKYKYAIDHEIPVSTFKRWVKLYQEYMAELVPATVEEQPGSFIMISDAEEKPMIVTDIYSADQDKEIRLRYKDAILEFNREQLREVMEIMRLW